MPALELTTDWTPSPVDPDAQTAAAATHEDRPDGPTFADVLDIINPLHHIPLIGGIYRAISGDAIAPTARMVGGSLYGGVIGFVAAALNVTTEDSTGQDIGAHVMALFSDDAPQSPRLAQEEPRDGAGAASGDSASSALFASQPGTWYAALEDGPANRSTEIWGGP